MRAVAAVATRRGRLVRLSEFRARLSPRRAVRHLCIRGRALERGPVPPDPPNPHVGLREPGEPVFSTVFEPRPGYSDLPKIMQP